MTPGRTPGGVPGGVPGDGRGGSHGSAGAPPPIRVLVVEDDAVAADAHALYVSRVPGFEVAGIAHTRAEAGRALDRLDVDLVLLDLYLPDGHGLALLRALRGAGHSTDVFAVTSARDLTVVREGVALGVVQHVLKPFTFPTLRDRLRQYAEFRHSTGGAEGGEAGSQAEVDRALSALRTPQPATLPKGLAAATLDAVTGALRAAGEAGVTATAAGEAVGVNRITARRYLEHLVGAGQAERRPQYGQVGRPEFSYRWLARY